MNKNINFIVENPGNCCYIDSLLMALFYSPSYTNTLLINNIADVEAMYLQECVKEQFVNLVQNHKSVSIDNINFIKYMLLQNGWKTFQELYEQQDISEFYTFLIKKFEGQLIEIKRKTISEEPSKDSAGKIEKIPFIPLSFGSKQSDSINVIDMLSNWMFDNIVEIYQKDGTPTNILNSYEINNTPILVGLGINRFTSDGQRINISVMIQKKIKLFEHNYTQNSNIEWFFHAAICHVGENNRSGHYYALIVHKSNWYIFNDQNMPCLKEIEMNDNITRDKIRKECVFLLYKLSM